MQELICQIRNKALHPSGPEDQDSLDSAYYPNQLVRCKTYAISKVIEPSVIQNNLLHACMKLVADNSKKNKTLAQVKFDVKVALHFVYEDRIAVRPDGTVQFEYRSFCFAELKNMERLNIFERAFDYLAAVLGITVEKLVEEAKKRMLGEP